MWIIGVLDLFCLYKSTRVLDSPAEFGFSTFWPFVVSLVEIVRNHVVVAYDGGVNGRGSGYPVPLCVTQFPYKVT